jgi:hypothetical protein
MKFTLSTKLSPSAPFGVPEDGYTVVPATPNRQVISGAIDSTLGKVVSQGSLRIDDNFAFVSTEEEDFREALARSKDFLERFLIQLSVRLCRSFSYEILGLAGEDGQRYPSVPTLFSTRVTTYNIQELREAMSEAAATCKAADERLERASQYFEHAAFLFGKRQDLAQPGSRHHTALISSIFLSLAKAVTVIVGDPSSDRDHQRRYKEIGLDHAFYKDKIGRVLELRNNYDVAHHDVSGQATETIEQNYGEAIETASVILAHYSEYLSSKE